MIAALVAIALSLQSDSTALRAHKERVVPFLESWSPYLPTIYCIAEWDSEPGLLTLTSLSEPVGGESPCNGNPLLVQAPTCNPPAAPIRAAMGKLEAPFVLVQCGPPSPTAFRVTWRPSAPRKSA